MTSVPAPRPLKAVVGQGGCPGGQLLGCESRKSTRLRANPAAKAGTCPAPSTVHSWTSLPALQFWWKVSTRVSGPASGDDPDGVFASVATSRRPAPAGDSAQRSKVAQSRTVVLALGTLAPLITVPW